MSVNFDNINEKVDMPLSFWVESLEVVQLDGSTPEAFVSGLPIAISENYFLIDGTFGPVKMYDCHSGKFLGNIGNRGRGKGEYHAIDDAIINEEKIIYLLPVWNDKIFVYSFDGKFIEEIPLPYTIPRGCFSIDEQKKVITIGQVPIVGKYYSKSVWQQDFKGNLIQGIDKDKFAMVVPGRTPEYDGNTDAFDFKVMSWENTPDTLFHYNAATNYMDPVFVVDIDN